MDNTGRPLKKDLNNELFERLEDHLDEGFRSQCSPIYFPDLVDQIWSPLAATLYRQIQSQLKQ